MQYEEDLVHNMLFVTHNAVVSIALKVKDNVLWVINTPGIVLQKATQFIPEANPPSTLLKVPNALVIKQVHIPSSKLKATKLQLEPAKTQALQQQHQQQLQLPMSVMS